MENYDYFKTTITHADGSTEVIEALEKIEKEYILKKDSKTTIGRMTLKEELKDHLLLTGTRTDGHEINYKIKKKPLGYNKRIHEIISGSGGIYSNSRLYVEEA